MLILILASPVPRVKGNQAISTSTVAKIKDGLSLAEKLGNIMASSDFQKTITAYFQATGPFLSAVGPLVSLAFGFVGTESAELAAIKRLSERVDEGFNRIDSHFGDIKREFKWLIQAFKIDRIEGNIKAVQRSFKHLPTVPSYAYEDQKQIFINIYEEIFDDSGTKLCSSILNGNLVYGKGLLESFNEHTQYDRKRYQTFTIGLLQLLLTASKLQLAYMELKYPMLRNYYETVWKKCLDDVGYKIAKVDEEIVWNSERRSKEDIDKFAENNPRLNNKEFGKQLFDLLTKKYYWLDWLVVVYSPIRGFDNHCIGACNSYLKFSFYGRNILVSHVSKTKPNIDLMAAQSAIDKIPVLIKSGGWFHAGNKIHAQTAYKKFPYYTNDCHNYVAKGVINGNGYPEFFASEKRLAYRKKTDYVSTREMHWAGIMKSDYRWIWVFLFG